MAKILIWDDCLANLTRLARVNSRYTTDPSRSLKEILDLDVNSKGQQKVDSHQPPMASYKCNDSRLDRNSRLVFRLS